MCYEMRRRAEACVLVFITAVPIVVVCVFITAVPITKLFACHGPGGDPRDTSGLRVKTEGFAQAAVLLFYPLTVTTGPVRGRRPRPPVMDSS
jgi:hypothetical protein